MRVNWIAILIAGFADWVLGGVWFKTFANQWTAGLRMPEPEMQAYMSHPNFLPYFIALVSSIVIAYVIARVLARSESHSMFSGIIAGALIGLAAALAMVTEMAFEARAGSFMLISSAYPLIGGILMGIVLGVWKPRRAATSQS